MERTNYNINNALFIRRSADLKPEPLVVSVFASIEGRM